MRNDRADSLWVRLIATGNNEAAHIPHTRGLLGDG